MASYAGAFRTVRSSPGSLLHYQKPSFGAPLWPGIHLDTDPNVLRLLGNARPLIPGSITPVLLLGKKLELCWALDSELREYDPFASTRDLHALSTIPGLAEAYESVDFALESGVGLEHWKEQIILQTIVTISDDDSRSSTLSANSNMIEDASDLDEDMQEAIRESRKEYHHLHGSSIPTAPAFRMQSLKRPAIKVDDELPEAQNDKVQVSAMSSQPIQIRPGIDGRNISTVVPDCLTDDIAYKPGPSNSANTLTSHVLDGQPDHLGRLSMHRDAIEGDLNESEAFVQIYVGPERQEYTIAKQDIWNRVYFRDPVSGRNYFDAKGEKTWELVHPRLVDIQPEAFECISEFLTSTDADFGIRNPDDETAAEETFSQCLVAWKTADLLGMDDLLDCIVAKIRKIEPWWTICTIMLFARNIYETTDFLLSAHVDMRNILSSYIAEHFFDYVTGGGQLRTQFLKHLQQLPQLERDIYRKRLEVLNAQLPPDDEPKIPAEESEVQESEVGTQPALWTQETSWIQDAPWAQRKIAEMRKIYEEMLGQPPEIARQQVEFMEIFDDMEFSEY